MNTSNFYDGPSIILNPRPYARDSGSLLLLPLLPQKPTLKPLPAEVWMRIFSFVFEYYDSPSTSQEIAGEPNIELLLICKKLKDVVLPLLYERVHIGSIRQLEKFTLLLHAADKKWDSIRRIPYSTPGRWVQSLNLVSLSPTLPSEAYRVDALLTQLFPLLPFLAALYINPLLTPSRRALLALAGRDGVVNLRILRGFKLDSISLPAEELFDQLLHSCSNLEELEVWGAGIDPAEPSALEDIKLQRETFDLPRLRKLALLSMPTSPIMVSLLHSSLPSLRHLTITPYDDNSIPSSTVPQLIQAHGHKLTSLHLYTHKSWPTISYRSPVTILHTCPNLHHLSLENPLPTLTLCSIYPRHPLQILSVPRPNSEFLTVLESLLPKLPSLQFVRARDVRWLRRGMSAHAQQAGTQGQMMEWRRRLSRRGIQVLDADWKADAE